MNGKFASPESIDYHTNQYIRRLNDLHVGTRITLDGLALKRDQIDTDEKPWYNFVVPSGGERETARIRRNPAQMIQILDIMIANGERSKALLVAVSITEDYLLNVLKLMLRAYPERIVRGARGGDAAMAVPLIEILQKGRDEILEEKIQSRLTNALYASPADYLKYLRDTLEVELTEARTAAFIETKATRDIIIHANGRVNEKYLEKAGALGRAAHGENLGIDQDYFDRSLANMKALMLEISGRIHAKYADDIRVRKCLKHFLT